MEDKVKVFLGSGDGYGYGYGSVSGSCDVSGFGFGYGSGSSHGDGYGFGSGDGLGSGLGDGFGSGSGYRSGDGSGSGDGYGYKINNQKIYNIDNINTIITSIKGNIAIGYIVDGDMTQIKTYITKRDGYFAHGSTLKESLQSLEEKIISNMDTDEVIEMFLKEIDIDKQYTGQYFFDWHGKLTGSCKQGRETFVKNKNINLEDTITLNEFIALTKNDYGGGVIKRLEERLIKE